MFESIIAAALLLWSALMAVPVAPEHQGQIVAAGMAQETRWLTETYKLATDAAETVGYPEIAPYTMAVGHYESYWSTYGTDWSGCSVGDYGSSLGEHQWHRYGLGRDYSRGVLCDRAQSYRLISEWMAVHMVAGYDIETVLSPWTTRDMALGLVARLGPQPSIERWAEVMR